MATENKKGNAANPDEIDLIELSKPLWKNRKILLKWTLIGGILGLIVAIVSPKEYVATSIMVPSVNDGTSKLGGMSGLGGLAAMAGINLNSTSGNEISPLIYPRIVSSLPYLLELMKTPLEFKGISKPVTAYEYYTDYQKPNLLLKYTIGLPGLIFDAIKGAETDNIKEAKDSGPLELTHAERGVCLILKNSVNLEADPKEGIITLTTAMPEARAAAQLGQRAQILLQKYITEFKIKKAKANLDFIQSRVDETTKKFEAAQQRLASFRDRNKNVSLATAKAEEEILTSQYNLIYTVYSELSKQLEQSKIQVKQETPVFTVIEPVSVPANKSKPKRLLTIFIGLFFGGILGAAIIYWKGFDSSAQIGSNQ